MFEGIYEATDWGQTLGPKGIYRQETAGAAHNGRAERETSRRNGLHFQQSAGPGCMRFPMFYLSSLPRGKETFESGAREEAGPGIAKSQPASTR